MIIDDSIILKYINGESPETYCNSWIYSAIGRGYTFDAPDSSNREWVFELYKRLKLQINDYIPRNAKLVSKLFPDFDSLVKSYTIMLVVGFPDPYDAMVLEHDGKEYMVFDLIQFGKDALSQEYSCHKVLTHELLHMCLHNKYPKLDNLSYKDELSYTAFDEGFAHAVSYPEDINNFTFNPFLEEKYIISKEKMKEAIQEIDPEKQAEYRFSADTGDYWDKFASICGKLYLLKHISDLENIYTQGWHDFYRKIT